VSAERSSAGVEAGLIAVLALVAGAAGVVWAGAELAALVFGAHRSTGAGFADALAALGRLPARGADPRSAWPPAVAARLPGPVGYWAATLPVAAAATLLAVPAVVWAGRRRVGVQPRRRLGVDPEGRMARGWDLAAMWVSGPTPGRLVLGRVGRRLVATEDNHQPLDAALPRMLRRRVAARRGQRGSVAVLGPSQCGKTSALAIPAILEWAGPVVALSVKSDLMAATIARRRRVGSVQVFDPVDVTWETSASWSPLRDAGTLAAARRAARSIANATDWTRHSGEMGFWVAAAEDLLAALFWTAAAAGLGMDAVAGWVLSMDLNAPRQLAVPLAASTDPRFAREGPRVLEVFDGVWRSDPKQISSVYLTARQVIRPWQEPAVQATAAQPRIDLPWLLDPGPAGTAANTLYLCADLDDAGRLAPVLGGLVDDLFVQAYARAGKDNQPLNPPLLMVIDEAGNWPMRNLPARISTCAGLGIQLLLVFQSKAQVDAAYGPRADIVLANAVTKVFFAGLSDESTLRYATTLLGSEHVVQRSVSTDGSPLAGAGRRSLSEAPTRVDLLPASHLRQVTPGQALLIHNTLPPAHLHGRYWYLDPDLHELATTERCTRRQLTRRASNGGRRQPIARRTRSAPRGGGRC
jgi:type IV secretion system protein VirD4